jgi:tRNA(fMet)-specific endonuclease VapC
MVFLDTNIVVDLLNARRPAVRERYDEARRLGVSLSLSTIALFELRYGIANSDRAERNTRVLEALLDEGFDVIPFDAADAAEAGKIRAHLRRAGTQIGPYDILIAGAARRRGATLVTSNGREFERVPGLIVTDWAAK